MLDKCRRFYWYKLLSYYWGKAFKILDFHDNVNVKYVHTTCIGIYHYNLLDIYFIECGCPHFQLTYSGA